MRIWTSNSVLIQPRTSLFKSDVPSKCECTVEAFRSAGFACAVDVAAYPAVIDREVWLEMMRNRFWSTFAGFSDGELAAGVAEVAAAHPPGPIAFEERVVFIVADAV